MKRIEISWFVLSLFMVILCNGCMKSSLSEEDEIPFYSSFDDLTNPPDKFKYVFSLRTFNQYFGTIQFEENSVWLIEKFNATGSGFNKVSVVREDDYGTKTPYPLVYPEQNSINVGFEGGVDYNFVAWKTSGQENITLILYFKKTEDDYDTFPNKIDELIELENQ